MAGSVPQQQNFRHVLIYAIGEDANWAQVMLARNRSAAIALSFRPWLGRDLKRAMAIRRSAAANLTFAAIFW
jgi:hypothetical protein